MSVMTELGPVIACRTTVQTEGEAKDLFVACFGVKAREWRYEKEVRYVVVASANVRLKQACIIIRFSDSHLKKS